MKILRTGVLVSVTVTKPLPAGRQAFRLGSNGYVNFSIRKTLPNPVLSRRSSFESLRTNGESKGTIRASLPLDETYFLHNRVGSILPCSLKHLDDILGRDLWNDRLGGCQDVSAPAAKFPNSLFYFFSYLVRCSL